MIFMTVHSLVMIFMTTIHHLYLVLIVLLSSFLCRHCSSVGATVSEASTPTILDERLSMLQATLRSFLLKNKVLFRILPLSAEESMKNLQQQGPADSFQPYSWSRTHNSTSIPAIIHQTWRDHNISQHSAEDVNCSSTLYEYAKGFLHILWTDEDLMLFLQEFYPQHFEYYNQLNMPIKRSDFARYLLLHQFGGVYMDLDMALRSSVWPLLEPSPLKQQLQLSNLVFVSYVSGEYDKRQVLYAGNAFMASIPRCAIMSNMINHIMNHKYQNCTKGGEVLYHTGPIGLGHVIRHYLADIILMKYNGNHTTRHLLSSFPVISPQHNSIDAQARRSLLRDINNSRRKERNSSSNPKNSNRKANKDPHSTPKNDYMEKIKNEEQERVGMHLQSNLLMFQRNLRQEIVRILTPDVVGNMKDNPSHVVHLRLHQW